MHRRDDWNRAFKQGDKGTLEQLVLSLPGFVAHSVSFFEIAPGTKSALTSARQHDTADVGWRHGQTRPEIQQVMPHLRGDGIERIGTVKGGNQDVVTPLFKLEGLVLGKAEIRIHTDSLSLANTASVSAPSNGDAPRGCGRTPSNEIGKPIIGMLEPGTACIMPNAWVCACSIISRAF